MIALGDHDRPLAYSCSRNLVFNEVIPASALRTRTAAFLSEIARGLECPGGGLPGHVKGLVDAADRGQLFFSITSSEEGARFKGLIEGSLNAAVLTINIIVYGIDQHIVEELFQEAFGRHFGKQSP